VAYGLWLNHKGRVLADSFALVHGPAEVWLISYESKAAFLRQHLENHIIADEVTIEDLTAGWTGVAAGGPGAMEKLQTMSGQSPASVPPPEKFGRLGQGWVFRGRRTAAESWEWLVPAEGGPTIGGDGEQMSSMALEGMRITDGVPSVPLDLGPGDLPHEAGLDQVALSYTKGCFLGQEVMARLRTGKIRRRLLRVAGSGEPPARHPTPLFQAGRQVGELRSSAPDGGGGWVGLAMVTLLGLNGAAPLTAGPEATSPAWRLLDVP